jgi:cobalt/nickel transport system permease protein
LPIYDCRLSIERKSSISTCNPAIDNQQFAISWLITAPMARHKQARGFFERTVASLADAIEHALAAEDLAHLNGLLQRLDPRVKMAGTLAWIAAAVATRKLWVLLALFLPTLVLAVLSRVPVKTLAKRVWVPVLIFTGTISVPALFLTPGRVMGRLPLFGWPVTGQGLIAAEYLVSRAETAATLAVVLVLSTPWNHVLKSLRVFRLPAVVVVTLGMTYRYIILLLQTARDMFESRQSRLVARLRGQERRRMTAANVGVLLSKSFEASENVYAAMEARGFRGEVQTLADFRARGLDWVALAGFFAWAGVAFWVGR